MLGARIAALRQQAGLSQRQLAEQIAVSPSAVGMYEQGRREPPGDRLVALARVFGVTTDYLLTGAPSEQTDRAALERLLSTLERAGLCTRRDGHTAAPLSRAELAALLSALFD